MIYIINTFKIILQIRLVTIFALNLIQNFLGYLILYDINSNIKLSQEILFGKMIKN